MSKRRIDTILIAYDFFLNDNNITGDAISRIQKAAPDARIEIIRNQKEWGERKAELGPKINVLFGFRPARWFDDMPNLRWAQQGGAGANWLIDAPNVVNSDMILTNASGLHAIPISEHILALIFALSRAIQIHTRSQIRGKWERRGRVQEIDGAIMGLIGVGAIGEKTAEKAKGLNMRVLGLRRHPDRTSPFVDQMFGPDNLHELLSLSDWIVITAALTSETRGMIGEPEFKVMKPTSFIINIARGPIIQEKAMIMALMEKRITGAGLDVFETEPLPENSPLWGMKNVVITPHSAGFTPRYMERLLDIFTENLVRYQEGEPLINVVDKQLGY
ncbi:D-2-hydroxyacid dehydrogenase [Thermodesulfobacteriota bacterium]